MAGLLHVQDGPGVLLLQLLELPLSLRGSRLTLNLATLSVSHHLQSVHLLVFHLQLLMLQVQVASVLQDTGSHFFLLLLETLSELRPSSLQPVLHSIYALMIHIYRL